MKDQQTLRFPIKQLWNDWGEWEAVESVYLLEFVKKACAFSTSN